MVPDLSSTADADVLNSLSDSAATFQTDKVQVGDKIFQITDNTKGFVKAVISETVLTCMDKDGNDLDLFPDGNENYKIRALSPPGLSEYKARIGAANNDGSSNLSGTFLESKSGITRSLWQLNNGYGSTNNKIQKFTNEIVSSNQEVIFVQNSATLGFSITANKHCIVIASYTASFASVTVNYGFSLNADGELTTGFNGITGSKKVAADRIVDADDSSNVCCVVYLSPGDVLRPHTDGAADGSAFTEISIIAQGI
jgi:hypothetical protein